MKKLDSKELRGFLTGLILGDGTIDKGIDARAFRMKSIDEEFIFHIREYLMSNTNFKIKIVEHDEYTKKGIHHKSYFDLSIKAHPYFAKKYHHFYDDNRQRRITIKTLSWLTPAGIANWYMSDGYIVRVGANSGKIKDRRVEIATDRYSSEDVDKMMDYFKSEYGFKTTKVRRRDGIYRIRFSLMDAQHFFLLIKDYMIPSMYYKMDLCYDYQPKWMCDDYYELMMSFRSASNPID